LEDNLRQHKPKKSGLSVEVHDGRVDQALRKFKRKVQDSGILQDVRDRQEYEKPTTKRKRKKAAAKARWQKKVRQQQEAGLVPTYTKIRRGK
jgi:small subunit ribosomal protein S21